MWGAIAPLLARFAFGVMISMLQRMGVINEIEASALRAEHDMVRIASHLKTYSTAQPGDVTPIYPEGRNSGIR